MVHYNSLTAWYTQAPLQFGGIYREDKEYKHTGTETKLPPFRRRHLQMHFIEWESLIFAEEFTDFFFQINNILALGQITAWHRPGDKPLPETIMVS